MKLVEIESWKVVDMWEYNLCIINDKVYRLEWKEQHENGEWINTTDASDKYRIESDVRSREEIEEKIDELNGNIDEGNYTNVMYEESKIEILEWVLKKDGE